MRVLILGGDGYLGWPTAMHLSAAGHEVAVVDNYLRRRIARDEDVEPLLEAPNLDERGRLWKERSGRDIEVMIRDLQDPGACDEIFEVFKPEVIVHYAEQPSAPYSMLRDDAARVTLHNNLGVTLNLILAVRRHCPDAHIVKLGTMGEYGTPNVDIPEGWFDFEHNGRSDRALFPRQAGSLYHTTKIMDTDLLWYYVRMWDLRVTDLMQGPVYGLVTDENGGDESLLPSFAYDEIFGTVLNRFIVQAVAGYPLTVYGKGGQTRGYLNLKDTLNCIKLAADNPPDRGELRIFNQFTETFSVNELASRVESVGGSLGINVEIKQIDNPRKEKEEHYYNPAHTGLLELGLEPNFLTDERLAEMIEFVSKYRDRISSERIFRGVKWA
ncbi:MAG: NAD-dependent epimerase/dehydratase family protein [Ilumatobacter sp.]|nr:NAD-dependent epimerase/dehydratase family protein [Phycisphaera sp.]MDG2233941.1 NAD-dependent epimerase/dehydratase family protein [Ilumatobacter sp.]